MIWVWVHLEFLLKSGNMNCSRCGYPLHVTCDLSKRMPGRWKHRKRRWRKIPKIHSRPAKQFQLVCILHNLWKKTLEGSFQKKTWSVDYTVTGFCKLQDRVSRPAKYHRSTITLYRTLHTVSYGIQALIDPHTRRLCRYISRLCRYF
jgi:hypothetical protein